MFKYLFKRDTLFATIAVFLVMGMFSFIPINTHFLDPIHLALADFDYNDLAYAKMHKNESTPADTNIVVVNIGYGNRQDLAAMINKVNNQNPKVIGVDVFFKAQKDAVGDSLLLDLFSTNKKIVTAFNFGSDSTKGYFYKQSLSKGYANFVGEEEGVIRQFSPILKEGDQFIAAFAVAVMRKADAKSYNNFIKRKQLTEIINYTRKADKYLVIDGMDLINGKADSSILTNKIVLLGYVSNTVNDIEDKHFTPMNVKYTGKSLPDMNGIFIHANIISMIKDHNYIQKMPIWLMWIIGFVLCWLHMALFIKDYLENHIWFHLLAKIAQIISAVFFVYLGLLCFHQFDLKVNMTATLAAIILAVDVLYFYEAFAIWMHKKNGFKTIFTHKHD
ncbi:CHASE2 domain-containing protein [Pedobacter polaris]|uniref:CHASE2 domain-containing protein n=1 Tax=Pedobacter polaris TaxID=2571273 RepID=A0A4U1CS65_9SPHI|nr:CHASE2 domain-containing protein [Pedobacter polaris]TKC09855.1 CHASE2 domain-containing protein [Pedobacter polaris]